MDIIVALLLSVAVSFAFRNAIKTRPAIFYLIAAFAVAAFASLSFSGFIPGPLRFAYPYIQRCLLAFGFLAVVMFIGVLPESSKARRFLAPIRGELSIIAAIFTVGHVINYLASYAGQLCSGFVVMQTTMTISFAVSFLLVILLAALAVTSIQAIRQRMDSDSWKRIQRLAYPFFFLVFAHLLLILGPSASAPEQKAFASIIVYTVVFSAYLVLRTGKAVHDRHERLTRPPRSAADALCEP